MTVNIENWKELKRVFSLEDSKKGERKPYSARQISNLLHKEVFNKQGVGVDNLLIPCGQFSELDCIFTLKSNINKNFIYSYDGTIG